MIHLVILFSLALFPVEAASDEAKISRDDFYYGSFPKDFVWSASTAAYQIEGAWNKDGRGEGFWDYLSHAGPTLRPGGFIIGNATGDIADDSYHKYKEDVKILKELGVDYYRFSISWTRILPNGTLSGGINAKGVEYYNNLITELLNNNIKPMVTIYHFDEPVTLLRLGGWTNSKMVDWFNTMANLHIPSYVVLMLNKCDNIKTELSQPHSK